ncbi:hypothetical protein LGN18_02020 [Burkholderia vietnamiensis]|nr:hypothetical protein [Burkholderia vietnamiensis]
MHSRQCNETDAVQVRAPKSCQSGRNFRLFYAFQLDDWSNSQANIFYVDGHVAARRRPNRQAPSRRRQRQRQRQAARAMRHARHRPPPRRGPIHPIRRSIRS